jgi:dipeptidyl-peptidase-4
VQQVSESWGLTVDLRAQYLAAQGFLVFKLDNRGSARRGLAFEAALDRRMGTVEVDDQAAGVRWLVSQGPADPARIGITGWSYGGYMTLMCLLKAPDVFRVGVAGAPVADWDGYDTHYTERYMGTPNQNPQGYREGSVLTHVEKLQGKLLLVHGMIDENVHFRHSARFLSALQETGRSVEVLVLPSERHMPRGDAARQLLETSLIDFFVKHLTS